MHEQHETCWTMVQGAATGATGDRASFATKYESLVRAYLRKRWRGSRRIEDVEDACQDVFLELFKSGGALERLDRERAPSFRAFLYGVILNVARRAEEKRARGARQRLMGSVVADVASDEPSLSGMFDRLWARSLVRQAVALLRERAAGGSDAARRRVELLDRRFREGLGIQEIADEWGMSAKRLHKDYATAREEFRRALGDVAAFHNPDDPEATRREIRRLASALRS